MSIDIVCQFCGHRYTLRKFYTFNPENKRANLNIKQKLSNIRLLEKARCPKCGIKRNKKEL